MAAGTELKLGDDRMAGLISTIYDTPELVERFAELLPLIERTKKFKDELTGRLPYVLGLSHQDIITRLLDINYGTASGAAYRHMSEFCVLVARNRQSNIHIIQYNVDKTEHRGFPNKTGFTIARYTSKQRFNQYRDDIGWDPVTDFKHSFWRGESRAWEEVSLPNDELLELTGQALYGVCYQLAQYEEPSEWNFGGKLPEEMMQHLERIAAGPADLPSLQG